MKVWKMKKGVKRKEVEENKRKLKLERRMEKEKKREGGKNLERKLREGRWIKVKERRKKDGGMV